MKNLEEVNKMRLIDDDQAGTWSQVDVVVG